MKGIKGTKMEESREEKSELLEEMKPETGQEEEVPQDMNSLYEESFRNIGD